MPQNAAFYRQIAVTFLGCAKDSKTASDRDQFLAAAIHYQQLARAIEDGLAERTVEDARELCCLARESTALTRELVGSSRETIDDSWALLRRRH